MNDDDLIWCYECWAWKPWKHSLRRPPLRIRLRRALGRVLERVARRLTGLEFEPEFDPPAGWRRQSCTIAVKEEP